MRAVVLLTLSLAPATLGLSQEDLREAYDVEAYRIDVRVDPAQERLSGRVFIELVVTAQELETLEFDADDELHLSRTLLAPGPLPEEGPLEGTVLSGRHAQDRWICDLGSPAERGRRLTVCIEYEGSPGESGRGRGVRWSKDGQTLVDISAQITGAQMWFPCKASRFHPEDRPRRIWINATVPEGLTAAASGRLVRRAAAEPGWVTWRWRHDYPLPTYGIGLAVANYAHTTQELHLPGLDAPVPLETFVLEPYVAAAKMQFQELPELLKVYSEAFGPWPFPLSKVGIAQGSWGTVDHSTLTGYGNTFPAWLGSEGIEDPLARRNRRYDYVLVHQLAHEWWGNAVGAASWRDAWLHEGFATYAEALWVEHLQGRDEADAFLQELAAYLGKDPQLIRTDAAEDGAKALLPVIYIKGAWVLNEARHYLGDDAHFFGALRRFQRKHRYGLATTEDLRKAFEEETGQSWERFFEEWVQGSGVPRLTGEVRFFDDRIEVSVDNESSPTRSFHLPLDLGWTEGGHAVERRLWLEPGPFSQTLPASKPSDVRVLHLSRLLGRHRIDVIEGSGPPKR